MNPFFDISRALPPRPKSVFDKTSGFSGSEEPRDTVTLSSAGREFPARPVIKDDAPIKVYKPLRLKKRA